MGTILESSSERRHFRLKNKKLQTLRKAPSACTGATVEAFRLEDLLCAVFAHPIFFSLSPCELANLESACRSMNEAINGDDSAALIWVASAYGASRGRRVLLPVQAFMQMPLRQIKHTLANMKYARGFMNASAVLLSHGSEFDAVSCICEQTASNRDSAARVLIGRLSFREQGLPGLLDEEAANDLEEQALDASIYLSNEMTFCWQGHDPQRKGTMLATRLGLLDGANVLEVSSVIGGASKSAIALSIDVHLISPLWPQGLTAEGINVRVDSSCSFFDLPCLDVTDEKIREAVKCHDGLLCVLVVNSSTPDMPTCHRGMPVEYRPETFYRKRQPRYRQRNA